MAIEDSFWKVYLVGTSEELRTYKENQKVKSPIKEESLDRVCSAELLSSILVGSFVNPFVAIPLYADTTFRIGRGIYRRVKHKDRDLYGPGLVGTVRELCQKHKK